MVTKRQKISISGLILAVSIFFLPEASIKYQYYLLAVLIVASYFLSIWSIYAPFAFFELISLFVLPVFLTSSFALFQIRFEETLLVRLILAGTYFAVIYTILLSENIFNVSTERNIPLVRAAHTVGYLATLFVSFSLFTLIFGLRQNAAIFSIVVGIAAVFLFAQGFWQINLKNTIPSQVALFSLVGGLIVGELALVLSFWPLDPPKIGLALTAAVYVILGILQHYIREDLTRRSIFEYLFVAAAVTLLLAVSTSWGV
jgi:hypothetical protein